MYNQNGFHCQEKTEWIILSAIKKNSNDIELLVRCFLIGRRNNNTSFICLLLFPIVSRLGYLTNWLLGIKNDRKFEQ